MAGILAQQEDMVSMRSEQQCVPTYHMNGVRYENGVSITLDVRDCNDKL